MSPLSIQLLLTASVLALPLGAQQTGPRYNLAELGSFVPGASQSTALDVNEQGQVVGRLLFGHERRVLGFVWERGAVRRFLPQPHDPSDQPPTLTSTFHQVAPVAINDMGVLAGTALEGAGWAISSGFFAEAGAPEPAPLRAIRSIYPLDDIHVADISSSLPYRLVGTGSFTDFTTLVTRQRAFVTRIHPSIGLDDGAMIELGTFGGTASYAEAVNAQGVIVGGATNAADFMRAFRSFDGGPLEDLGTLGGPASHALDVSENGVIVGWSELRPGLEHAFRYEDGVMQDLGTLGGTWSRALGVDATGTLVVGASLDSSGRMRACLWRDGQAIDLNQCVSAGFGWNLVEATAVNSSGVIVGRSRAADGREQAFALEPASSQLVPMSPNRAGMLNELALDGVAPGALVAFLRGDDAPGYSAAPGSMSGGLLLDSIVPLGFVRADASGHAGLVLDVPLSAAGLAYRLQAFEFGRLAVSNVEAGVLQ